VADVDEIDVPFTVPLVVTPVTPEVVKKLGIALDNVE